MLHIVYDLSYIALVYVNASDVPYDMVLKILRHVKVIDRNSKCGLII